MNKKAFQNIADRAARKATEQLNEHLQDVGKQIASDQMEWLDNMMRDILPPRLYDCGRRQENLEEVEAYLNKHKFKIVFIPDSHAIRIMRGDQIHAQWAAEITIDGEKIRKEAGSLFG